MALRPRTTYYQHFGNKMTVAPAEEPVTLAELKDHLRITNSDDDSFITTLITEARQFCENRTGLAFVDQSWKLTIDRWPHKGDDWWDGVREGAVTEYLTGPDVLEFPRYPLDSVTSMTTYDESGTSTAVTVSTYFDVDTDSARGRLLLKQGQSWPTATRRHNAIEIVYVAGYGAAADVPEGLKRGIRSLAAYLYEHRGTCGMHKAFLESGCDMALGMYKNYRV